MITDEKLAELSHLAALATPGPWRHAERTRDTPTIDGEVYKDTVEAHVDGGVYLPLRIDCDADEPDLCEADAKFIAASRTAVPELLAEVARLRRRLARGRGWIKGPPPGRGRWWVVWNTLQGETRVEPVEISSAVLVPNGPLLFKTMTGAAYQFEANREAFSWHAPLEAPEAPR